MNSWEMIMMTSQSHTITSFHKLRLKVGCSGQLKIAVSQHDPKIEGREMEWKMTSDIEDGFKNYVDSTKKKSKIETLHL